MRLPALGVPVTARIGVPVTARIGVPVTARIGVMILHFWLKNDRNRKIMTPWRAGGGAGYCLE